MQHYEISHIIDNEEWESKLIELSQRCQSLNGWTEKDLLQFAVNTMPMYKPWLMYLEDIVVDMEQEKRHSSFFEKLFNKHKED